MRAIPGPEQFRVRAEDKGKHAPVDTGNWTDEAREAGLKAAFPLAATCDFKARQLAEDLSHPRYDLKECFDIGWRSGFRHPWCLEHFDQPLSRLLKNLQYL